MIRHISVFRLSGESQIEKMKQVLKEAGESSPIVLHTEVGENITHLPDGKGPVFGDLVQILDFANEKDCALWPSSREHLELVAKTKALELLCAIDYELN